MAVNKVNLVGRLGADPTFHHIDKNNTLSRINVAVHDCDYDSSGNKEKVTNWITVILWNRLSYISKNLLCKGATVSVEGKVVKRSYTDKNGIRQYVLEVEAQRIECLCKPENKQPAEMDETDNEATCFDSEEPDYYDDPFGDEEDGAVILTNQNCYLLRANNGVEAVWRTPYLSSLKDVSMPQRK